MKLNIGGKLLASERSLRGISLAPIDSSFCVSAWLRLYRFRNRSGNMASIRRSRVWISIVEGAV